MTEYDPIFRILWELSKVDGKKTWFRNSDGSGVELHPSQIEPGQPREGKVKRAFSTLLKSSKAAKEAFNAGHKAEAREVLIEDYPPLDQMRPRMWKQLFKWAPAIKINIPRRRRDKTPLPVRERFRRILRRHAPKSFRDIFSDETWPKVIADFKADKLLVPTLLRPRPEWSVVKLGTPLFTHVKENLRRYYYEY